MLALFTGTYSSKERVLAALNHEKADRVPVSFLPISEFTGR